MRKHGTIGEFDSAPEQGQTTTGPQAAGKIFIQKWRDGQLNSAHCYAIQKILEQEMGSKGLQEIAGFFIERKKPEKLPHDDGLTRLKSQREIYEIFMSKWRKGQLNKAHVYAIARVLEEESASPRLHEILEIFMPKAAEPTTTKAPVDTRTTTHHTEPEIERIFFNAAPSDEAVEKDIKYMMLWHTRRKIRTAVAAILAALAIAGIAIKKCVDASGDNTSQIEIQNPDRTPNSPPIKNDKSGERTKPIEVDPDNMGFNTRATARLTYYGNYYSKQPIDQIPAEKLQRTMRHRLKDHEILLTQLLGPKKTNSETVKRLRTLLGTSQTPMFIDIGPGLGNTQHPGITGREIAENHPDMPTILLDLPEVVSTFRRMNDKKQLELLENGNIHIVSGNGLESLKAQLENQKTNPFPKRKRPQLREDQPLIVRAANSIDIYCEWEDAKRAVAKIAQDFAGHPVLLLWNREIIIKPAESVTWTIIGQVSPAGFDHKNSKFDRKGEPAFQLFADRVSGERRDSQTCENMLQL